MKKPKNQRTQEDRERSREAADALREILEAHWYVRNLDIIGYENAIEYCQTTPDEIEVAIGDFTIRYTREIEDHTNYFVVRDIITIQKRGELYRVSPRELYGVFLVIGGGDPEDTIEKLWRDKRNENS